MLRSWPFLRGWKVRLGIGAVLLFFVIPGVLYLGAIWHGERKNIGFRLWNVEQRARSAMP